MVGIEKLECDPVTVKHQAWKGHDLGVVVVVAPHLDRQGVGTVDPDFLQLSQQVAIVVLASDEISLPLSVLAHFLYPPARVACEVVVDSLEVSP